MVGNILASEAAVNDNANDEGVSPGSVCQIMYMQVRPGLTKMRTCLDKLKDLAVDHGRVDVEIAGYAVEDHQFVATLAVGFGPRNQIAKPSIEAQDAFLFVNTVFAEMFDYLPQFSGVPTSAEQDLARSLPALRETPFGSHDTSTADQAV